MEEQKKIEEKVYNPDKAIKAQRDFCRSRGIPDFFPSDGVCYACKRCIFVEGGIDVKRAGESHITGCPLCHRSYCD